jgi:hypothetical protein
MARQQTSVSGARLKDDANPSQRPRRSPRDRDVVKMARMILVHFPDGPGEVAHALLMSAAKQND